MTDTDVKPVSRRLAMAATPERVNLICELRTEFFQDTVASTIAAKLASGHIENAEVIAQWEGFADLTLHAGTIVKLDDEAGIEFEDGISVPLDVIVSIAI